MPRGDGTGVFLATAEGMKQRRAAAKERGCCSVCCWRRPRPGLLTCEVCGTRRPSSRLQRLRAMQALIDAVDRASRDEGNEPTETVESAAIRLAMLHGWRPR